MFNGILGFVVGVIVTIAGLAMYEDYQRVRAVEAHMEELRTRYVNTHIMVPIMTKDMRDYIVRVNGKVRRDKEVDCRVQWRNTILVAGIESIKIDTIEVDITDRLENYSGDCDMINIDVMSWKVAEVIYDTSG